MKLKHTIALLSSTACALVGSAALAAGTAKFEGSLATTVCTPRVNGVNNPDGMIALPEITPADFPNTGDTAGETTFTIGLAGCAPQPGMTLRAYFYSLNTLDVVDGRVGANSSLGGVGWHYEILPATGSNRLTIGTTATPNPDLLNDVGADFSTGNAITTYRARYYRTAETLVYGIRNGPTSYVLDYQ